MAIQFSCENCRQPIEVDDEAANQRAQCPYCQQVVQVPSFSDVSIAQARPQPSASLQTALPVPHRQGAPATPQAFEDSVEPLHRPAMLGYMALTSILISIALFIAVGVVLMPHLMPLISPSGQLPETGKIESVVNQLVQDKPWLGILSSFYWMLGLVSVGLAVASFVRSERPRWPAFTVLGLIVGFVCLMMFSFIVMSAMV